MNKERIIKNCINLAIVLIIINIVFAILLVRSEQYKKYKEIETEYNKVLLINKELSVEWEIVYKTYKDVYNRYKGMERMLS